ncbi:MAG: NHL repeat-containing protein [Blastocatellia bacterium]
MRKILLAVLILALPSAVALNVYYFYARPAPTSPDALGSVSTIAGAGHPGVEDGKADKASFSDPFGIAVDKNGNVIVADAGDSNRLRRISQDGNVKTIAGSEEGFRDGDALRAQFNTPSGIAIDRKGNIIIADTVNNRIRKLSADGRTVSTIAGSGKVGFKDGPGGEAWFDGPMGVAVDKRGNIFVADAYNDCIRKISDYGEVTTVAGGGSPGYADGAAASALFDTPSGVFADKEGNIYVADTGNDAIRKITPEHYVSTIAGGPDAERGENQVDLSQPVGLAVTHDGFVFISDQGRGRIVRLTPGGHASVYVGKGTGFADGAGYQARFNGPGGIAIDREGNLYIADSANYLVREVFPFPPQPAAAPTEPTFVQPAAEAPQSRKPFPNLARSALRFGASFPWPLAPQDQWHEVSGVMGEARGAPGGIALDHLHSGLDLRAAAGDPVLSVLDEKVTSPIASWDFDGASEGIHVGLFGYIHIRVGRNANGEISDPDKFKPRTDGEGRVIGVRVRRGTRFKTGDFVGSVNRLNHVHLNLGPWSAQANPLQLSFLGFKDTVPPTVEPNGIDVWPARAFSMDEGQRRDVGQFREKRNGRLVVSGDVAITVTAYDRADGNGTNRKLGLFRIGYQLLNEDGTPAEGFEQPFINIEFDRLPPDDSSVSRVFAPGSGVSAYGTPTRFKYIVTNRVRDGEAINGFLRASSLAPGNYLIRVIAEDFTGNRASGNTTELPIIIAN